MRKETTVMTTLDVAVPDELVEVLGSTEEAKRHLTRTAVLDLVRRQAMSQGKGAEILDMSLWEFLELMSDNDVPMVDLTELELKEGHSHLKQALAGEDA